MNADEEFRKVLAGMSTMASDIKALDARIDERRKINAIITAYDVARADPKFVCPSYLMAAIERARLG